jgi:hypothetical protein
MNLFIYQTVDGDLGFIEAETIDEALAMVRAFVDKTNIDKSQLRKATTNERNTHSRRPSRAYRSRKKERSSSRPVGDVEGNPRPGGKDAKTWFTTDQANHRTGSVDARPDDDQEVIDWSVPGHVFRRAIVDVFKAGREAEHERLFDLLIEEGVIWRAGEDSRPGDSGVWFEGDYLFIAGQHKDGYLVINPLKGLRP